jgi:predicted Co/Zn/Cd cation transporter (cation efflux family)
MRIYGENPKDHEKEIEQRDKELTKKYGCSDYMTAATQVCREKWLQTPLMKRTMREAEEME